MNKKYIIYVTYDIKIGDTDIIAYISTNKDVFHTIGEIIFRSLYKINRITFVNYNEHSVKWIEENNIPLVFFREKYIWGYENGNKY